MDYRETVIRDLAKTLHDFGLVVYLAGRKTYGFYTDTVGSRVVTFGLDCGVPHFSGNYAPSTGCGSGWRLPDVTWPLTKDAAEAMLYANAPQWTGNARPLYTTANQHLDTYQASSKYERFTD